MSYVDFLIVVSQMAQMWHANKMGTEDFVTSQYYFWEQGTLLAPVLW